MICKRVDPTSLRERKMEDHSDESKTELMTADGLERLKQKLAQLEQKLADLRLHKGQEAIHAGEYVA